MALSPTDSPEQSLPEASLLKIAALYETALAAMQQSDLDEITSILNRIDTLARGLKDLGPVATMDPTIFELVAERHSRLMTALVSEKSKSEIAIEQTARGRKALRGYGNRADTTGTHLQSLS